MSKNVPYRINLPEEYIPKQWYNICADMKDKQPPLLNPSTLKPATLDDLSPVFAQSLQSKSWMTPQDT